MVDGVGIVLWEMLTGMDPWGEIESLVELVEAVCVECRRPVIPREDVGSGIVIPDSLRQLIQRCWTPDMDARLSFDEIIPLFDHIILDALLPSPDSKTLWRQNFLSKVTNFEYSISILKIPNAALLLRRLL